MAIREQELHPQPQGAVVYEFPGSRVRSDRIYRRRRMALAAAVVALALAGLTLVRPADGAPEPRAEIAPRSVVIRPGDTLWAIAMRYAPEGSDPRAYVDELIAVNRLEASPQAGERLRLPR